MLAAGWPEGWVDQLVDGWMGWVGGLIGGWMDGLTDRWVDGWEVGEMGG